MQGFNKYYPPDYDSRQNSSLNSYRGVHALGVRAKDIDKGILVVRFELPFNIWCGHCNAHIGAGVRYNAQKRKVGAYYSTPIFAFRCKCHLCSGWFEIRTDPQNARYVVEEGARAQVQDWEPEENGGYKAHDTDAPSASEPTTDAFSQLEKTNIQSTLALTTSQRLDSLASLSYRQTSDPYTMSQHLRAHHRLEKRADRDRAERDEAVKSRYGLSSHLPLAPVDPMEGKTEWARESGRSKSRKSTSTLDLSTTLRKNTVERYNPFDRGGSSSETMGKIGRGRGVVKVVSGSGSGAKVTRPPVPITSTEDKPAGLMGLTGYDSADEEDGE